MLCQRNDSRETDWQTGIPFAVFALRCCHNRPPCRLVLLHTWESSLYFPPLEPAIPTGTLSTLSLVPMTVWCTIYRHNFLLFNSVHRRFALKKLTTGPLKKVCSQFSFQPPSSFPHTWSRKHIWLRKCVLIISRRWIESKKMILFWIIVICHLSVLAWSRTRRSWRTSLLCWWCCEGRVCVVFRRPIRCRYRGASDSLLAFCSKNFPTKN